MAAKVKKTNIFLPVAKSSQLLSFFQELQDTILFQSNEDDQKLVRISSLDVGLKDTLFEQLLVQDTKLLLFAFLSVIMILWFYSRSFMIVMMSCFNLSASLGGSLVIYRYIYGVDFFPFMNLMTVIILVAVGTDSTFILSKAWSNGWEEKVRRPVQDHLVSFFRRTLISTLLTNGTTALALLASVISDITSLKCFSLYSSTAVVLLYILTTLSIPAVLVVVHGNDERFSSPSHVTRNASAGSQHKTHKKLYSRIKSLVFQSCCCLKYFFLVLMLVVSSTSIYLLVRSFQVPDTQHFSTFHPDHPFETFDVKYRDVFKFSQRLSSNDEESGLPITVVFGVKAVDNGFRLDPFSRGTLEIDQKFDISYIPTQRWLLNFCHQLRNVSFYRPIHGPLLSNCFIETFKTFMEGRKCFDDIAQTSHFPCCQDSSFPYSAPIIDECLGPALEMFYRTPTYVISREAPGVRFSRTTNKIIAIIIQYYSNISYTNSYSNMKNALNEIDIWFQDQVRTSPSLSSSWFISDHLELFALQDSLISGTKISVLIALCLTFVSVFNVTQSFLLTLFAVLTIGSIMTCTLATLFYWFNWQVNVIESVVILVAIGISVDLPLHFVIGFKSHEEDNLPNNRTFRTLSDVGIPLLAAALTTAVGGVWMLRSHILAYLRIGMFLVVISFWNLVFTFIMLTCLMLILESWSNKASSRQSQTEFLRNDLVLSDFE